MTFGSLFAGIGGLDLGLERAGLECRWQVEIDDYATRVLAKHWPNVRRHDDITTFPAGDANDWRVDVICGGFPCQDISVAGTGAGLDGDRSGLWREFARVLRVLRPRFAVVENSPALAFRGLGVVLRDLADLGFNAWWEVLPACAFGATHMRRRMFVVAYADSFDGQQGIRHQLEWMRWSLPSHHRTAGPAADSRARLENPSKLYGSANGVPHRVDRNRGVGNAVFHPVAEWIGRRLIEMECRE